MTPEEKVTAKAQLVALGFSHVPATGRHAEMFYSPKKTMRFWDNGLSYVAAEIRAPTHTPPSVVQKYDVYINYQRYYNRESLINEALNVIRLENIGDIQPQQEIEI